MEELAGGPMPEEYSPFTKGKKVSPYSILRDSQASDLTIL